MSPLSIEIHVSMSWEQQYLGAPYEMAGISI